mmetsp:Transcript_15280/g.63466  ORF Transcript_15280/g.63466 Transcript_15280/m.63466 type:complete len:397 (+) Transcript_15280:525-1715(+)
MREGAPAVDEDLHGGLARDESVKVVGGNPALHYRERDVARPVFGYLRVVAQRVVPRRECGHGLQHHSERRRARGEAFEQRKQVAARIRHLGAKARLVADQRLHVGALGGVRAEEGERLGGALADCAADLQPARERLARGARRIRLARAKLFVSLHAEPREQPLNQGWVVCGEQAQRVPRPRSERAALRRRYLHVHHPAPVRVRCVAREVALGAHKRCERRTLRVLAVAGYGGHGRGARLRLRSAGCLGLGSVEPLQGRLDRHCWLAGLGGTLSASATSGRGCVCRALGEDLLERLPEALSPCLHDALDAIHLVGLCARIEMLAAVVLEAAAHHARHLHEFRVVRISQPERGERHACEELGAQLGALELLHGIGAVVRGVPVASRGNNHDDRARLHG